MIIKKTHLSFQREESWKIVQDIKTDSFGSLDCRNGNTEERFLVPKLALKMSWCTRNMVPVLLWPASSVWNYMWSWFTQGDSKYIYSDTPGYILYLFYIPGHKLYFYFPLNSLGSWLLHLMSYKMQLFSKKGRNWACILKGQDSALRRHANGKWPYIKPQTYSRVNCDDHFYTAKHFFSKIKMYDRSYLTVIFIK